MLLKRICLLTVVILGISVVNQCYAQYFNSRNGYWKNERHAFGFGVGAINFLGELGGRDQIGTNFINDLELSETRPNLMINYRYQFGRRFFARAQYTFGIIGGNDVLTEEIFRRNRNLHFRSTIHEISLQMEANILDFSKKNLYDRDIKQSKLAGSSLYVTAGVGVTRFNPQGNFNGDWYKLRALGTEGQMQDDGPEPYSLYTVVIPVGIGFRIDLNRQWNIGLEVAHRITFTDYIDDVSTVYYDNDVITQSQGELAAYFADPSLGYYVDEAGNQRPLNSTETGLQRGDPNDNDAYLYAMLTTTYKISQRRFKRTKGRVTKRRTRRVLF